MKIGMVSGRLQPLSALPALEGQNLLVVNCGLEEIVAINRVGAKIGDRVLVGDGFVSGYLDFPGGEHILAVVAPERSSQADEIIT